MRYMKKNSNKECAFTLIEILLVSAMLTVVGLAIYATFNNGVKIWQRVNKEMPQEDLGIFFEKFRADLRNSLAFKDIGFLGTVHGIEFPTLIDSRRLDKRTVGKVIYSYDPVSGIVEREEKDFSHIYSGHEGIVTQSLKGISFFEFQYYSYDKEEKEYVWQGEWEKENLPLAVRIGLKFDKVFQDDNFTKTISVPLGS